MSRPRLVDIYAPGEDLSNRGRNQCSAKEIEAFVNQGLAEWCKGGAAAQLTEPLDRAFVPEATITHRDNEANAGADDSETRVATARQKVGAWPSVYDVKSPLPGQPGSIREISLTELQAPFVSIVLEEERAEYFRLLRGEERRENRRKDPRGEILRGLLGDDPDNAYYFESPEEVNERKYGLPIGLHEFDPEEDESSRAEESLEDIYELEEHFEEEVV